MLDKRRLVFLRIPAMARTFSWSEHCSRRCQQQHRNCMYGGVSHHEWNMSRDDWYVRYIEWCGVCSKHWVSGPMEVNGGVSDWRSEWVAEWVSGGVSERNWKVKRNPRSEVYKGKERVVRGLTIPKLTLISNVRKSGLRGPTARGAGWQAMEHAHKKTNTHTFSFIAPSTSRHSQQSISLETPCCNLALFKKAKKKKNNYKRKSSKGVWRGGGLRWRMEGETTPNYRWFYHFSILPTPSFSAVNLSSN